jgi:hypothetical protein
MPRTRQQTSILSRRPVRFRHVRSVRRCLALFFVVALSSGSVFAEVILLRNGQQIEGRIVSQNRQQVVVQTGGSVRVIPKTQIARIVFSRAQADVVAEEEKKKEEERRAAEQRKREEEERARRANLQTERANRAEAASVRDRYASGQRRYLELAAAAESERTAAAAASEEERRKAEEAAAAARSEEERLQAEAEQRRKAEEAARAAQTAAAAPSWTPLFLAAGLPGAGHFYAGDTGFGLLYSGAFALAGYNAYTLRRLATDAQSQYQSYSDTAFGLALLPENGPASVPGFYFETARRRAAYERAVKRQNQSMLLLGGVYLAQLTHAFFVSGGPSGFFFADAIAPEAGDVNAGVILELSGPGAGADEREMLRGLSAGKPDERVDVGYGWRF